MHTHTHTQRAGLSFGHYLCSYYPIPLILLEKQEDEEKYIIRKYIFRYPQKVVENETLILSPNAINGLQSREPKRR